MRGNAALLDAIKAVKKNINITSVTITTAHTTFTDQVTLFLSLTGQLDDKIKELEEREVAVVKLEHEARAKVQQLEEREKKCLEKEKEVEERDKSVQAKEAKWNEIEKRMQANAKLSNVIHLNVSGKRFSIEKEKLLQHEGSLFEQMVNSNHPPLLSNSGDSQELFINRDSKLFAYISQFLVLGELVPPSNTKELDLLAKEFGYFNIPFPVTSVAAKPDTNSITLNVGGTKFTIAKEKMLQHKGSLFESIAVNPQQFSSGGKIFLARDPRLFKRIMQFVVHEKLIPPLKVDVKLLQQEFEYFRIPFQRHIHVLLERAAFADKIAEWLPNKEFRLLYKASEHGFGAAEFHKHCDNNRSTLVIIRSKDGYLFGGYSVLPWDSTTNGYKLHPEGFIFTLSNPHNIPPTKYPRNQNANAIGCYSSHLPIFGSTDICVCSNSNQSNSSYTGVGASYTDLTGKGKTTFTGARYFTTSDIEVFAVL